jgi:hypothetical protein
MHSHKTINMDRVDFIISAILYDVSDHPPPNSLVPFHLHGLVSERVKLFHSNKVRI